MILDLSRVVALHLVRLHLLPVGLLELGGELFVLLLRDKIFAHFVLRVEVQLTLDLRRASVDLGATVAPFGLLAGRLTAVLAPSGGRALHGSAASTCATTLFKFDDLMQVLVLEQERQSQITGHVALGLFSAFLGQPSLIFKASPLLIFELLVLLEELGVDAILALFTELEIIAWLVLVNVDVQVGLLDETRSSLRGLEVEDQCILGHSELDPIT